MGPLSEKDRRIQIARSQLQEAPQNLQPRQPGVAPQVQSQGNPLSGMAKQAGGKIAMGLLKKGLGSAAMGPFGALLGGFLNNGGKVGYNDGGQIEEATVVMGMPLGRPDAGVNGTPIKRVADEQKIELDMMSWERMEGRKDQQMMLDEQRKQEAFMLEQERKEQAHEGSHEDEEESSGHQ